MFEAKSRLLNRKKVAYVSVIKKRLVRSDYCIESESANYPWRSVEKSKMFYET